MTVINTYTKTAIFLHWLMALCMVAIVAIGLVMGEEDILPVESRFLAYQLHKSLGLTFLILTGLRLAWRLTHKAPPPHEAMSKRDVLISKFVHIFFYILMITLPLTGWAAVSASPHGIPTLWFGQFEWPHISFLTDGENKAETSDAIGEAHETLAWICILLIILHIAAALQHHFIRRDDVLIRMIPFLKRKI